ncbi:Uncharacterized protein Fot_29284 [Forsythia ovata]|uniref:Uncharacterized protein n=1 Tax=Forsythia ovata TaxID=205694 RepID=A0ABD1TRY7_9LAMI
MLGGASPLSDRSASSHKSKEVITDEFQILFLEPKNGRHFGTHVDSRPAWLKELRLLERKTRMMKVAVIEKAEVVVVTEKAKYAKFRNCDVREIYHMYLSLFGHAFDSDKYVMTPTKLSQCGIDGVISGSDSPHDTLPINAETRDSNKGPIELRSCSRMDISGCHSREKRKGSTCRSKEKDKKIGSVDLSYSVEHLASVGETLVASRQICQKEVPSSHQCITEFVATSKVPKGSALYNFALTFLVKCKNRNGFVAAEEPEYKLGWIHYNFEQSHNDKKEHISAQSQNLKN